jgi:hypothetical protein
MIVISTLPKVWLNSQVATNVKANGPVTPPTTVGNERLPPSTEKRGGCQMVTSTARIAVETSGERVACRPGEGESAPSRFLTHRTVHRMD